MVGLTVENTKDKIVFSIDKSNFTEDVLMKLMKIARLEFLIKEAAFDASILTLGEDLKEKWWQEHKKDFLSGLDK